MESRARGRATTWSYRRRCSRPERRFRSAAHRATPLAAPTCRCTRRLGVSRRAAEPCLKSCPRSVAPPAEICLDDPFVRQYGVGFVISDLFSVVENQQPIGQVLDGLDHVLDDKNADALITYLADHVYHRSEER